MEILNNILAVLVVVIGAIMAVVTTKGWGKK